MPKSRNSKPSRTSPTQCPDWEDDLARHRETHILDDSLAGATNHINDINQTEAVDVPATSKRVNPYFTITKDRYQSASPLLSSGRSLSPSDSDIISSPLLFKFSNNEVDSESYLLPSPSPSWSSDNSSPPLDSTSVGFIFENKNPIYEAEDAAHLGLYPTLGNSDFRKQQLFAGDNYTDMFNSDFEAELRGFLTGTLDNNNIFCQQPFEHSVRLTAGMDVVDLQLCRFCQLPIRLSQASSGYEISESSELLNASGQFDQYLSQ